MFPRRMPLFAVLILLSMPSLRAQSAVDPSGHWEGTIHAPEKEVSIEFDLARNAKGELAGTFSNPAQKVKGLPLSNIAVQGTSATFEIKASAGGGTFQSTLATDGKSMNGTFSAHGTDASHGIEIPFDLTRTGEARIEVPPRSSPISKELEVDGAQRQVGLTMANHPDGTATGSMISSEGVEIPITVIVQKRSSVTLDVKNISGSYAGTLKGDGTELVGTWTQGKFVAPLTFRRAAAK